MKDRFKLPMTGAEALELLLAAVKCEVEYRHCQFVINDTVKAQVETMAEWLTSDSPKFGILLCGGCGNGKTTLVKAFQQLLCCLNLRDEYNRTTYGMQIKDARQIVRMMKFDYPAWEKLSQVEMLAIEDLGIEAVEIVEFGNVICPIVDILTKRYDMQLFTIITTNLTPAEIREKYGDRIADRMNEMMVKIIFNNPTYRT
jgi:DNA replication protein DnaC